LLRKCLNLPKQLQRRFCGSANARYPSVSRYAPATSPFALRENGEEPDANLILPIFPTDKWGGGPPAQRVVEGDCRRAICPTPTARPVRAWRCGSSAKS